MGILRYARYRRAGSREDYIFMKIIVFISLVFFSTSAFGGELVITSKDEKGNIETVVQEHQEVDPERYRPKRPPTNPNSQTRVMTFDAMPKVKRTTRSRTGVGTHSSRFSISGSHTSGSRIVHQRR
jgi:hypothetical protein